LTAGPYQWLTPGYTINDERKQKVNFGGPYYIAGQDLLVPVASTITGPESLAGKKDTAGCNKINDILKAAAADGSYKKAWDDSLGKSGKPAPELDVSKLTNCA
jgi:ABC-type amino acid transport substrate-binding protein